MLKHIPWRTIAAGLIGAALVLLVAWPLGWIPTYVDHCQYDQTGHKECTRDYVVLIALLQIGKLLRDAAPVIAAIATGFIGWFTYALYKATAALAEISRTQAKIAETQADQNEILQRAYLSAEMLGINPYLGEGDMVVAHVSFRNVGRLPASNVTWSITKDIDPNDERKEFVIKNRFFGDNVIAPGTPMTQGSEPFERPNSDAGFIYVWGEIRYRDGFNANRFTRFCHRYNCKTFQLLPERTRRGILAEYGRYHEYGNSTDEG